MTSNAGSPITSNTLTVPVSGYFAAVNLAIVSPASNSTQARRVAR